MLESEQIKHWISAEVPCSHLAVEGDGHHFSAVIVSEVFAGLGRVKRQQLINDILKPHFDSGLLHALSMQTITPEEWKING